MKVSDKLILVLNDQDGLAAAISSGLYPDAKSSLQKLTDSFDLTLEHYGIKDSKASGKLIHFVTPSGQYEVSVLVLQNYEPPVLACALNEVLLKLSEDKSAVPTLVVPVILPESKLKQENQYSVTNEKVSVYGLIIGPTTDVSQVLNSRLQNLSQSARIYQEHLALLLQLVNVMKLPTVVLIGLNTQPEVISEIGEHLASVSSLSFSKEQITQNPTKTSRDSKEAWRALYG